MKRRRIIRTICISFILLLFCFMTRCVYLRRTEPLGWVRIPYYPSRYYRDIWEELRNTEKENYSYALPSDITSPEGEPLLSWRVNLCLKAEQEGLEVDSSADTREGGLAPKPRTSYTELVHVDKSWNSPENQKLRENLPCMFDSVPFAERRDLSYNGTLMFRIKETHEKVLAEGYEKHKSKPYIVFVHPKYAVNWTEPGDLSWKTFVHKKMWLPSVRRRFYISVDGELHIVNNLSKEEWETLFEEGSDGSIR